jgi:cation diffusion facilitator family transporter
MHINTEKQQVALSSVLAALVLVILKVIIGLKTGSLGILSEAAHSALDLGAAGITLFAVRMADKPADALHTYGHGKIENISALIETVLLLITCGWIMYEAIERLAFGKATELSNIAWGIGIMSLSIVIDFSRSRALSRAAKKYKSQALEADALHFSSDVWGSLVVILGLVCVKVGDYYNSALLNRADALAALAVSLLIIRVSVKLGKRAIDVLLDTAPQGLIAEIMQELKAIQGVLDINTVRLRPAGSQYFIDLNVGINKNESHQAVHAIVHEIRERLTQRIPNSNIMICTYPVTTSSDNDQETWRTIKKIVDLFPVCTNIHNIHVYEISGKKRITIHIEIRHSLDLQATHDLSHRISRLITSSMPDVEDVNITFETMPQRHIIARDITSQSADLIKRIEDLVNKTPECVNCHDIKIFEEGKTLTVFLHCALKENFANETLEKLLQNISQKIKTAISGIENIHIHVEPLEHGM